MNPVTDITATELASRIAKGEKITIVDVRQAKDYARGHIKGALKVPGFACSWAGTGKLGSV